VRVKLTTTTTTYTKNMSKRGLDTLLTTQGKSLETGQEIRFLLVKGPSYSNAQADPVNPSAPKEQFPLIVKFPESVVKPDFSKAPWNSSRLYQQDVPKAQDDSDEEVEKNPVNKKRWKSRRKQIPKRQWIMQEQVDFLQTMMAKRQKKQLPKTQISSRYEGMPEHNPSQYVLMEVAMPTSTTTANNNNGKSILVTTLPTPHATVAFAQPAARKTLTMAEAEQAIENQRGLTTRFMMHSKQRMLNGGGASGATIHKPNESKARLFGKLKARAKASQEDEDDDDIMGDLAFRNRKGAGGKARKELLSTVGDSSIKVDPDGVLGGANDSEFGRGRKFGRFKTEGETNDASKSAASPEEDAANAKDNSTRGNDGSAMADDFYQRDVQAEYEELDYDANEQFDDDDVDLGESEVVVEGGGYADDDDDDDEDEDDLEGDTPSGAEGLATVAGFRLLLAKARGDITPEQAAEAVAAQGDKNKLAEEDAKRWSADANRKFKEQPDHLAQIMAASEKTALGDNEMTDDKEDPEEKKAPVITGVEVDDNGMRMVTLQAIRREIWLHHGTIPMKRLMKIFDIKKKSSQDRQNKFREAVKELCTMETDPVGGRMLVLKQHYSNMG
jgi:hypothetical protein